MTSTKKSKYQYWETQKASNPRLKRGFHKFSFLGDFEGSLDENRFIECLVNVVSNEGYKVIKLSGRMYEDEKTLEQKIKNAVNVEFSPYIGFKWENKFIGVGDDIGIKFEEWLKFEEEDLWVRGDNGIVVAGEKFHRVVSKLLNAMYEQHNVGLSFGLCVDYLYVNNDKFILSDRMSYRNEDFGIWKDLLEFQKLVKMAVGNSFGDVNYKLFEAIFPQKRPINLEIRRASYFICHTPLFWSLTQRFQFANAYNSLRNRYPSLDNALKMNFGIYNLSRWSMKITALMEDDGVGTVIKGVYQSAPTPMTRSILAMQFIRILFHHYFEHKDDTVNIKTIDDKILEILPGSFSKTWGEILFYYRLGKLPMSSSQLINCFKEHGLCFDKDRDSDNFEDF